MEQTAGDALLKCRIFRWRRMVWVMVSVFTLLVVTRSYYRLNNPQRIIQPRYADRGSNTTNAPLKVLLITYYRGGSTLLGEAFNRHPDAMYWFEPLLPYLDQYDRMRTSESGSYQRLYNHSIRHYPVDYIEHQADVIVNILNCNFDDKLDRVIEHFFVTQWEKSEKMKPFRRCLHQHSPQTGAHYVFNETVIARCKPLIDHACRSSPIRAVKTIRVALYMLPIILRKDPAIKVVYYIRDPRASYVSHSNMWDLGMTARSGEDWAEDVCYRMHEDHKWLSTIYNNSVLLLYYEKLTVNFQETLNKLYSSVSVKLPDCVVEWFRINTRAGYDDSILGTTRKNSTETAVKWKSLIPEQTQKVMTDICQTALDEFGYTEVLE